MTIYTMLLPETLSILSKNPIFVTLYNVVATYFILALSPDLNIIYLIIIIMCYIVFIAFKINHCQHSTINGTE